VSSTVHVTLRCRPARAAGNPTQSRLLDPHGAYPQAKGGAKRPFDIPSLGMVLCLVRAMRFGRQMYRRSGRRIFPATAHRGTSSAKGGSSHAVEVGQRSSQSFRTIATAAGVSEFDAKLLMNHAIPGVNAGYITRHKHASRCEPVFRADPMADISKFSIVTYERKPGHWRAPLPEGPRWDCRRGRQGA